MTATWSTSTPSIGTSRSRPRRPLLRRRLDEVPRARGRLHACPVLVVGDPIVRGYREALGAPGAMAGAPLLVLALKTRRLPSRSRSPGRRARSPRRAGRPRRTALSELQQESSRWSSRRPSPASCPRSWPVTARESSRYSARAFPLCSAPARPAWPRAFSPSSPPRDHRARTSERTLPSGRARRLRRRGAIADSERLEPFTMVFRTQAVGLGAILDGLHLPDVGRPSFALAPRAFQLQTIPLTIRLSLSPVARAGPPGQPPR